ncbi:MAG: hypothetical protein NUV49_04205 [Patescibacteria group bacterium]|nr:hypothetical protein [Patescibacteria group bacterium]
MLNHTPTPYEFDDESVIAIEGYSDEKPFYRTIAKCDNWETNPGEVLTEQDKADLAFPVKAANSHDELVKAILWLCDALGAETSIYKAHVHQFRKLIK